MKQSPGCGNVEAGRIAIGRRSLQRARPEEPRFCAQIAERILAARLWVGKLRALLAYGLLIARGHNSLQTREELLAFR